MAIISFQSKNPAATHRVIAMKVDTKCKTLTYILNKKEVILQNAELMKADSGYVKSIKRFRRPLNNEVGAIFAVSLLFKLSQ